MQVEHYGEERVTESDGVVAAPRWVGALGGLVAAGAGLGVGHLVAGVFESAASPVVPVGDAVIDNVPTAVKDWAIETFGKNDKIVLIVMTVVIVMVVGALAGINAIRRRWGAAFALVGLVMAGGVVAVFARPEPTLTKALPALIGACAAAGGLWWFANQPFCGAPIRVEPSAAPHNGGVVHSGGVAQRMGVDRRRVLTTGTALAAVGASGWGVGTLMRRRFEVDEERKALAERLNQNPVTATNAPPASVVAPNDTAAAGGPPSTVPATTIAPSFDLGVDGATPFVVANDRYYRIDTALVVPQVSVKEWRLAVRGMVDTELSLTFDDLLAMPQIERHITLSCVSNPVGGDLIGNALWRGVRLTDVLDLAGVQPGAEQLASRSVDGWTCGSPMSVITDGRDAMLALAMNGEPLPQRHGYPVRLVVPGLYGYVSATKWVTELQLTTWDAFDGYWIPRGWSKEGPVKLQSRIDTVNVATAPGQPVVLAGVAWAVHREVVGVELSIDDGDWFPVTQLGDIPSNDTWRLWRHDWFDASPGNHAIRVRAIAADGEIQTGNVKDVAPDGAEGWHRVRVKVPG